MLHKQNILDTIHEFLQISIRRETVRYTQVISVLLLCPLSKNIVCAFQITYKLISFTLEDSQRYYQMIKALHLSKAVSTISKHVSIEPFTMGVN